jgi:predicted transglutaminase-like cysteine proteinase
VGLLVAWLALGFGCASSPTLTPSYQYFATPASGDPWTRKIQRWQGRERNERSEDGLRTPAAVAEPGAVAPVEEALPARLHEKYRSFRAQQKRDLARQIAEWIQSQASSHYVPDGPIDRWATLEETLREDGDDCDGLELLTFHMLRDLGFSADSVYRAIVYRRSDGQHHMVTLWFEDREDPWVIDPTGAMTTGMPRMSEVSGWVPLKVFSEDRDYTVERMRFVAKN